MQCNTRAYRKFELYRTNRTQNLYILFYMKPYGGITMQYDPDVVQSFFLLRISENEL